MKKLVLLLSLLFVFNSCSLDDEPNVEYVILPVESVEMPVNFNVNVITGTTADTTYTAQNTGNVITKKKMFDQSI